MRRQRLSPVGSPSPKPPYVAARPGNSTASQDQTQYGRAGWGSVERSPFRVTELKPVLDLDQKRVALSAARADRSEAETTAVSAELVDHRPEDSRTRRADRMTESDGAAVHVHLLRIGAKHLRRVEDDRRKRLVQLHPLDVVNRLPDLLERLVASLGRRPRQVGEVVGDVRLGDDRRERLKAALLRELLARDDERAGTVVHARRIPRGRRPFGVEHGLERRQLLDRRVAAWPLVHLDVSDGNDLVLEPAVVDRVDRAL